MIFFKDGLDPQERFRSVLDIRNGYCCLCASSGFQHNITYAAELLQEGTVPAGFPDGAVGNFNLVAQEKIFRENQMIAVKIVTDMTAIQRGNNQGGEKNKNGQERHEKEKRPNGIESRKPFDSAGQLGQGSAGNQDHQNKTDRVTG